MTKTALVTGGHRGIGAAVSERLAAAGYDVLIVSRKPTDAGAALVGKIRQNRGSANVLYADVRETHEISEALATCGCEQLDLLVNNAGIVRDALIPQTTLDNWNDTLATNFWGSVRVFRQCQPFLKRARCGTTVSLGSISGLRPRKGHAAYSVSKAMLIEWTRQQAARCPHPTLRFFCVSPGPTDTEMIRDAEWYGSNDAEQRVPLGRFAEPSEIAGWIVFLAQNPDTIANGTNLVIDGGMLKA